MKNKLKFTYTQLSKVIHTERQNAESSGFWFGLVLATAGYFALLFGLTCWDNYNIRKQAHLCDVAYSQDILSLKQKTAQLQKNAEADAQELLQAFTTVAKRLSDLEKQKPRVELPQVWNGSKLND